MVRLRFPLQLVSLVSTFLLAVAVADFTIENFIVPDSIDISDSESIFEYFGLAQREDLLESGGTVPAEGEVVTLSDGRQIVNFLPVDREGLEPYDQPLRAHAEINFFSKEFAMETCVHGLDSSTSEQARSYTRVNETAVLKYSDVPVQSNFEFIQFREDPNLWSYPPEYRVKDPRDDPYASVQSEDGSTWRGVEEVYDGTYLHQAHS